jgi:hypothetical protein
MITPYLEQLIHQGRAAYRSLSLGAAQQFKIDVPANGYIVIYEYYYKPFLFEWYRLIENLANEDLRSLQYVNFISEEFFHPYAHFLNPTPALNVDENSEFESRKNYNLPDHQKRDVYIIARKDFSIYLTQAFTGNPVAIPINTATPVVSGPITEPNLGYATIPNITSAVNIYHQTIQTQFGFAPFGREYSNDYLALAGNQIRYNQLYFNTPDGIIAVPFPQPETAYGKAVAPHLTINYVEIYEEQPGTYQA